LLISKFAGLESSVIGIIGGEHSTEDISEDVQMSGEKIDGSGTTALTNSEQNKVVAGAEAEPQSNDSEDLKGVSLRFCSPFLNDY